MQDGEGNIYGRGAQDMKSVGMQYLEAIRILKGSGFQPTRSVHVSYVPDEELGGGNGMGRLVASPEFSNLNVGITLDEGLACAEDFYRVFFGERSVWKLIIKAAGAPGHGSKKSDGTAMENLRESLSAIYEYRESQFRMLKQGLKAEGEVVAINNVFLRAGTSTPSVSTSPTAPGFRV
jgi:aminoacylase